MVLFKGSSRALGVVCLASKCNIIYIYIYTYTHKCIHVHIAVMKAQAHNICLTYRPNFVSVLGLFHEVVFLLPKSGVLL